MRKREDKEINKAELNEVISLTKKILKILSIALLIGLALVSIILIQKLNILGIVLEFLGVISAFFIGFVIAWLLKPIVLFIDKKIKNNTISSLIVFTLFVILLLGLLYIFIPTLYEEVNELVGLLPGFISKISNGITDIFSNLSEHGLDLSDFQNNLISNISSAGMSFASKLPDAIINMVVSLFSGIGTFVMGLIIGIYMLIDYDNIFKKFCKLFLKHEKSVNKLCLKMSVEVRKCVNGTLLVALVVFVCDSIGFAIIGLNAPLLFGIFCGLTDLIPFIGPYIGGAAAVIVGFTQDPLIGIGTLIICVIVQMVESYILQPIVMSKASNTHPIVIIIALLVFGHFFGIIGMILATPVIAVIKVLYEFIREKIDEHYKNV